MKKIITFSFILSILMMLAPAPSQAQFGNVLKKAKKKAKKVLKEKPSKDKKPKVYERGGNKDVAVTNSENATKNKTWIYPAKLSEKGSIKVSEMNDEPRMRNESGSFLSSVKLALGTTHQGALAIKGRNKLTENHRPFFIENNYEPGAHEILLLKMLKTEWAKRRAQIDIYYNNIDEVYQESSNGNFDNAYMSDGELILESMARTLKFMNLFIFPEDQELKELHNYAEKRASQLKSLIGEELDEISINDVHRANLNKVLFTNNKNINPQTAPASAYITVFAPGEEIYAVAMLDKGISEKLVRDYNPEYMFQKGKHPIHGSYWVEHETFSVKDNQQYFVFPLVIEASNFKCSKTISTPQIERSMEHLSTYGPRKHTFTLLLNDNGALHSAQGKLIGDFTIDGSQGDMTIYQKMANDIRDKCARD